MRLIDADALLEVLNKKSVPFNANVNDAILTVPTVDAVEVVRCKDCRYYVTNYAVPHCGRTLIGMKKSDYCSFGERKEDNER